MADERFAAIVECLRDDRREEYEVLVRAHTRADQGDELWKALGRADGQGFNLVQRLAAWPTSITLRKLLPALAFIPSLDMASALQVLRLTGQLGQSYGHLVPPQLAPHIAARPDLGTSLGEALRADQEFDEAATRAWARAFAIGSPEQAAQYSLALLAGGTNAGFLLATLLQFLPMSDAAVTMALQPHEANIAAALFGASSAVGEDVWHALTAIAGLSPTAMNELQRAMQEGEVHALHAVAHWFYKVATPAVGATDVPLGTLVRVLLKHSLANAEVRQRVDSGVASLMFRQALRPIVLPCIAELGQVDGDVVDAFGEIFERLSDRPDDFIALVTDWLVSERVTFAALRSVLAQCTMSQQLAGLNAELFSTAPVPRQVVAARRLLALLHNGPTLCLFIAALAETVALQPAGLEMAGQMLNEAFAEYPAATVGFLESRTGSLGDDRLSVRMYREFLEHASAWREVLASLPRLNELRPTDTQLYALHGMRQRMNREIMRVAEERSIFAAMTTRIQIAQGRRFASHTTFGPAQVVDMQEASHSIELPSSELADPVGGMLRRARALEGSR